MPKYVIAYLLLSLVILSGCSLNPFKGQSQQPLLLLSPAMGPAPTLLKQKLTFTVAGKQQQFMVLSDIKPNRFKVLVLMPTGVTLLKMSYDGNDFSQQNLTDIDIPAEQIMAEIQFALWPQKSLLESYSAEAGWNLQLDNTARSLYENNTLRLQVEYTAEAIMIENRRDRYQVKIQLLNAETD